MQSRESATMAVKILTLFVLIGLPSAIVSLAEHWNMLKAVTKELEGGMGLSSMWLSTSSSLVGRK